MSKHRSIKFAPSDAGQRTAAGDLPRPADATSRPSYGYPRAGVIVDDGLNVLEFLGNTGPYLQLPVGKARLSLRLMLNPALQHPVLESVRQVLGGGGTVRRTQLALTTDAATVRRVNVEVSRVDGHQSGKRAVRLLFDDAGPLLKGIAARSTTPARQTPSGSKDERAARLKDELVVTRATLESIIEEQEIGTARLKSAYYQLESVNAELEATNEELATANVELEALNEQLAATIRERDAAEKERDRMEAEFIQSQRLEGLRVLAGGVAHDFNNLLTSIVGNANVLIDELPRESELWEAAEQIDKAGQHAAALVKQMLAFCGKGAFTTEALDLSALISDSVELLRASIAKTAELHCELSDDLPAIEADATQLRQVLINLVVNASEALGPVGGSIRISARRLDVPPGKSFRVSANKLLGPGCYVCLEVADTGRGMDAETKAKLFEPFFSTKFPGRGLGMAAVQGIVRGHHGSVQVHSRPALGTEIEILFPALGRAAHSPKRPAAQAVGRARGTILVVDDEESVRTVAKAILKRASLRVITASGGAEALRLLRSSAASGVEITAVLLDMVMPGINGIQVVQELRSFAPDLPVILSSGYAEEGASGTRLADGPTTFLAKPYLPAELLERVVAVQNHPGRRLNKPEAGSIA